jgi:hypothetical protein
LLSPIEFESDTLVFHIIASAVGDPLVRGRRQSALDVTRDASDQVFRPVQLNHTACGQKRIQGAQVARAFGHGNDPEFGMVGIVNDADVGAYPSSREFDVLQIESPLLGAGRRHGRFSSTEHRQVALQAQPVVPIPLLQRDQEISAP